MPRNTVAGASLGVNHPDYDPDGPVPPIVPEGIALDAPIADQLAALESITDEQPVDDTVITDPADDEPAVADKPAPKKTTRK